MSLCLAVLSWAFYSLISIIMVQTKCSYIIDILCILHIKATLDRSTTYVHIIECLHTSMIHHW